MTCLGFYRCGVMVVCAGFAGCVNGPAFLQRERPNLGISDDSSSQRASISLRQVRVRNLGSVSGEGVVSVAAVDSFGTPLMEVTLLDGAPIRVPAANLGGAEGRVMPISGFAAFESLVDSLARTNSRFGLRARIQTTGGDADESDNVKTREWGPWLSMAPSGELTINFNFAVSHRTRAARVRMETVAVPSRALVDYPWSRDGLLLPPGRYTREVRLVTPKQLPMGSVFAARLTLTDSQTGVVLQQHERIAVYDTVPPMLSSYRAVLLRDGRVAIQVQAGDRHSGVSENGVATEYSLDGGTTWRSQVHVFVEDDFGRPALFETVLGPFSRGADLLIGVHTHDVAGNTSERLPVDASVFAAPRNAELLVDSFDIRHPNGNPVFGPATVARRAAWVDTAEATLAYLLARRSQTGLSASERFELRRLHELRTVPRSFDVWRVDVSGFIRVDSPLVWFSPDDGSERTVLRIGGRR